MTTLKVMEAVMNKACNNPAARAKTCQEISRQIIALCAFASPEWVEQLLNAESILDSAYQRVGELVAKENTTFKANERARQQTKDILRAWLKVVPALRDEIKATGVAVELPQMFKNG